MKVKELARCGITLTDIARYLELPDDEIVKDYSDVFHQAIIDRNVEIAETVYRMAIDGNLTACQFWLKNLGKWESYSENIPVITEDKVYGSININVLDKTAVKTDVEDPQA